MITRILPFLAILTLAVGCGTIEEDLAQLGGVAELPSGDLQGADLSDPLDPPDGIHHDSHDGYGVDVVIPSESIAWFSIPASLADAYNRQNLDDKPSVHEANPIDVVLVAGEVVPFAQNPDAMNVCIASLAYPSNVTVVSVLDNFHFKTILSIPRTQELLALWPLTQETCAESFATEVITLIEVNQI